MKAMSWVRSSSPPARHRAVGIPANSITCFANVLDELDSRGCGGRTEDGHASLDACVGHAGRGRGIGADDHQVHRAFRRKTGDRGRIGGIDGDVLGNLSGAPVARRDDHRHIGRIATAGPGQRMLASAGSDDEDPTYSHSIVDGGLLEMS